MRETMKRALFTALKRYFSTNKDDQSDAERDIIYIQHSGKAQAVTVR